jgi:hypothetical protein
VTPEGQLKKQVKHFLTECGAYFFMPVQTGYGRTTVDFLCCIGGRFVAIETKAKGKTPTPLQLIVLGQIREAGGVAFWTDNIEKVKHELRREGLA